MYLKSDSTFYLNLPYVLLKHLILQRDFGSAFTNHANYCVHKRMQINQSLKIFQNH